MSGRGGFMNGPLVIPFHPGWAWQPIYDPNMSPSPFPPDVPVVAMVVDEHLQPYVVDHRGRRRELDHEHPDGSPRPSGTYGKLVPLP